MRLLAKRCWGTAAIFGLLGSLTAVVPVRAEAEAAGAAAKPHVPKLEAVKVDVLIYNDGDRVRGHLVERTADMWVFQSERFGLLRVPLAGAKVELAGPAIATTEANAKAEAARVKALAQTQVKAEEAKVKAAETRANDAEAHAKAVEAETNSFLSWSVLSPVALAQKLRQFFGPWHGRFALSTQTLTNATETTNDTVEAHLHRKWAEDDVQLNARYDFADTNHVTTTDIIKADASWRHDFPNKLFSIYSPSLEWNRAFLLNNVPSDYLLLQQEFGVGVNIFAKPTRNLRVGIAENLFDVWQTVDPESHTENNVESLFVEADWTLPWRMKLSERGVWYYSIATGRDGWENKVELDKKLTETFTIGIRHETRRNNPDIRVQDYTLLKLLMGVDF